MGFYVVLLCNVGSCEIECWDFWRDLQTIFSNAYKIELNGVVFDQFLL
jgi:hypothetical protein